MDDLDDELDLRFHRGVKADVYYRIPTSESLDAASTITVPVAQQSSLEALIEPQDYAQSIQVEYALCRELVGKDRLAVQRAISKSIVAAIEEADGFKYSEHSASSTGDGARFRYVCQDSLEKRNRKANKKKKETDSEDNGEKVRVTKDLTPTYDCGGAIHVKFSIKRDAINVVYKHNPIHRDFESRQSADEYVNTSPLITEESNRQLTSDSNTIMPEVNGTPTPKVAKTPNGTIKKRKRSKTAQPVTVDDDLRDPELDMSTSPDAQKSAAKKKRKSNGTTSSATMATKPPVKRKKASTSSPSKSRTTKEPSPPRRIARNRACIRCREKKIKCNEAQPSCNQCKRGLWTCQYELVGPKQRSRNGCLNCKQPRRKCTEEKPSCARCLSNDDDCEYAEYS